MAEEVLTALQAPLWVRDVSIARHVDEHSQPFVEFEVFVQDLPMRTLTALVLPKGNPLVLHLSESLARDLRKGLERRDAPGTHALPLHDVAPRPGAPLITPIPASGHGTFGDLLGFQLSVFDVRGATIEGYVDQDGERYVQFEVLIRDLPTDTPLALVLPEGNPLVLHLSEALARAWWKGLVDTVWWGESAELC